MCLRGMDVHRGVKGRDRGSTKHRVNRLYEKGGARDGVVRG